MPKHQEHLGNRRNQRVVIDEPFVIMYTCPDCGKQAYQSRKDAKVWARRLHQGKRIRLYRCHEAGNTEHLWHVTTDGALKTAAYRDYNASRRT